MDIARELPIRLAEQNQRTAAMVVEVRIAHRRSVNDHRLVEQNMLDKTMIIYGSPMGDSNLHNHRRCPLILLGKANGQLAGNIHLKAPDGTPMANAMLTVMHSLGMTQAEQFGDSTGRFELKP